MPACQTTPAQKRKESEALASCIKRTGFEMFLCSGCEKRNLKCIVSDKENSGRCSECVLRKAKCDAKGIPVSEWRALELETDRLERESEAAMRAVCENIACLERLEKQKRFLKSKGKDMVCRGLKTLDELEEVEEKERQMEAERAAAVATARPSSAYVLALSMTETDPFAGLGALSLLPEAWAEWDFAYENPQPSQGT
jgi:hypothetical protein